MEVKIEKLDHFGRGICHIDNKICFVEGALPGEVVDITIQKDNKKMMEASVSSILVPSSCRMESACPYVQFCGGCHLQEISFLEENSYKENKVKEILERFGEVDASKILPIVSHQESFYRNKIVLHGKNGILGLYQKNSHDIVPISKCLLVLPKIQEIMDLLESINIDIQEVTIKCSNDEKEVLVDLTGEVSSIEDLKELCDVFIYNGEYLSDKHFILNPIGDYSYYESSQSFFQVNHTLTKDLYDEVLGFVQEIRPSTVLDLYCGCGTIGIYVSKYCDSIIGVDYNASNISDAKKNVSLNNLSNVTYYCDKVENLIDSFSNIDFVIVDPPRAGLDPKTKDYLKRMSPKHIAYVSCDPVTLARDLKDLSDKYEVNSIKPFNMFPRTYHVECVCFLKQKY